MRVGLVYDSSAVKTAGAGNSAMWALHRAALAGRVMPRVPSVVASDMYGRENLPHLSEFLETCELAKITEAEAYLTGRALHEAGSTMVAEATVVARALWHGDVVVTAAPESLAKLAESLGFQLLAISVDSQ